MPKFTFEQLKDKYKKLWDDCVITQDPSYYVNKIILNKSRYESVGLIPWDVLGCIHGLEASFSFSKHLHNGDPLTARTVQVPAGRPINGTPPFTWEESAKDALSMKSLPTEWTIERKLYFLESYNGFGYYSKGINSPYLWSFTNNYTKGKYVADGKYDPEAVSKQCGAAAILKKLEELNKTHVTTISKPVEPEPLKNNTIQNSLDRINSTINNK